MAAAAPLRLAVLGLCGLCLIAPLWIGGALHGFAVAVHLALALLCALTLSARPRPLPVGGRAFLLLLALPVALGILQLLPLPQLLLAWLSPRALLLRGAAPAPLTLDRPETQWALLQGAALLVLGALILRLSPRSRERRLLLDALVLAGTLQALVAALHAARHHTRSILWLYPMPAGWDSGLGTFVNRNHAASLLLLGLATAAGALAREPRWPRRLAYGGALLAQAAALLASGSRAALAVALLFLLLLPPLVAPARRPGLWRWAGAAAGLLCAALVLAAALLLSSEWATRLRPLWDGSILRYQKVRVWQDALLLVRDFPLFGVGLGAFQSAFAAYRTGDEYVLVPYPATLPLQHATSYGAPAALLLWGAGALVARALWSQRQRLSPAERGAALGALGVVLHCLAEYSLELLGVAIPTVVAVAVALAGLQAGLCQDLGGDTSPQQRPRPLPPLLGAALCLALCLWAQRTRPHLLVVQKQALRQHLQRGDLAAAERLYRQAQPLHPSDPPLASLGAATAYQARRPLGLILARTNQVLRLHPADVDAHRIAALALARAGHKDQAAGELRLAFWRGLPPDHRALAQAEALVGAERLVDLLRQHPSELRGLATYLTGRGFPALADGARARAALAAPAYRR